MHNGKRLLWGLILAALMLAGFASAGFAQTPEPQEFPGSGYTVTGEFLTFYRSLPDPYVMLGLPINDAEVDPLTGRLMQYFQRGRLELDPNAPAGQQVRFSNVAELQYVAGGQLAPVRNSGPTCRSFPTGHNVCYGFLQFYELYQGDTYFGNPISDVELANGRMVQYFENVRLEWRGEVVNGRHVGLSDMGRFYYDLVRKGSPPPPSSEIIGNPPPGDPVSLNVRAFVKHSLLSANSQQTLYIVVQDQALNPVHNASITVDVSMPDGTQQSYRPRPTDADGITVFTFSAGDVAVKQIVHIDVAAALPELQLEQQTSTWFRIWW
jgi:hypothetical protein